MLPSDAELLRHGRTLTSGLMPGMANGYPLIGNPKRSSARPLPEYPAGRLKHALRISPSHSN